MPAKRGGDLRPVLVVRIVHLSPPLVDEGRRSVQRSRRGTLASASKSSQSIALNAGLTLVNRLRSAGKLRRGLLVRSGAGCQNEDLLEGANVMEKTQAWVVDRRRFRALASPSPTASPRGRLERSWGLETRSKGLRTGSKKSLGAGPRGGCGRGDCRGPGRSCSGRGEVAEDPRARSKGGSTMSGVAV